MLCYTTHAHAHISIYPSSYPFSNYCRTSSSNLFHDFLYSASFIQFLLIRFIIGSSCWWASGASISLGFHSGMQLAHKFSAIMVTYPLHLYLNNDYSIYSIYYSPSTMYFFIWNFIFAFSMTQILFIVLFVGVNVSAQYVCASRAHVISMLRCISHASYLDLTFEILIRRGLVNTGSGDRYFSTKYKIFHYSCFK